MVIQKEYQIEGELAMKRWLCLLLALLMIPATALCETVPEGALYRARLHRKTALRAEPKKDGQYVVVVDKDDWVYILKYGEDWCYCSYEGSEGWVMTERLYELWRVSDEPLPGWVPMSGVACITKETHIKSGNYSGNDLQPGYLISAINDSGDVPMLRSTARLEEDSFVFIPFVSAEQAQPGDLLYAFTTWYNERTGMEKGASLARGRRTNIALGVERVDGTVIAPGEQFSFNALCAPYTAGNGYVKAPNISVEGVGVSGGVCQVSTTIFEALLGLDIQLDEWGVHRYTGVNYAPVNFDCAVATWKDFAFTNTYDFPLSLQVVAQEGALTALFFRAEE